MGGGNDRADVFFSSLKSKKSQVGKKTLFFLPSAVKFLK